MTQQRPFNLHTEERERERHEGRIKTAHSSLDEMHTRPRFEARPVPRSHYNLPKQTQKDLNKKQTFEQFNPQIVNEGLETGFLNRKPHEITFDNQFSCQMVYNSTNPSERKESSRRNFEENFKIGSQEWNFGEKNKNEELSNSQGETFFARPMPIFENPFKPAPSNKPLTVPDGFELRTEKRMDERSYFDEQIREKERLEQFEKQALEIDRAKREQEAIREMRKKMEFKARPVEESEPFNVQYEHRMVTASHAPELLTAERANNKEFSKFLNSSFSDASTNVTFN